MITVKIGHYIAKESIVHKLHPLIKLLTIIIIIATSAVSKSSLSLLISFPLLLTVTLISKISILDLLKTVRPFMVLLILTFLIQLLFKADGSFDIKIDLARLVHAFKLTYQFFFIIALSSIFTLTTSQLDIARALYVFTKPLSIFKIDRKEIAISIMVAIRFIPLLFDLADRIITSQKLRGLWKKGSFSIFKNAKIFLKAESFIVPLFIKLIDYAEKISITLNYKENIDQTMKLQKIKTKDILLLIACIVIGGVLAYV